MPINTPLIIFLFLGMTLSVVFRKLTLQAAITGVVCALLVYTGAGYTGVMIMTAFFVIGTLATSHKAKQKERLKAAEANHGQRKTTQVLANAGVAALAGALSLLYPDHAAFWSLAIASAFSAATADTLASEVGTVYGKRFYNVLSLKPDERGLDGVISLEGTLVGMVGSVIIALIYLAGNGADIMAALAIVIGGTLGNLTDSLLGAALERRGVIKNDAVNFLNTLTGASIAVLFHTLLR